MTIYTIGVRYEVSASPFPGIEGDVGNTSKHLRDLKTNSTDGGNNIIVTQPTPDKHHRELGFPNTTGFRIKSGTDNYISSKFSSTEEIRLIGSVAPMPKSGVTSTSQFFRTAMQYYNEENNGPLKELPPPPKTLMALSSLSAAPSTLESPGKLFDVPPAWRRYDRPALAAK